MMGSLGALAWTSADVLMRAPAGLWDGWPVPVAPARGVLDIPLLENVFTEGIGPGGTEDYYEILKIANEFDARVTAGLTKADKNDIKRQYLRERLLKRRIAPMRKQLRRIKSEERAVRQNRGQARTSVEMGRELQRLREQKHQATSQAGAILDAYYAEKR